MSSGHQTKTETEVDGGKAESREVTSPAVMSALELGSRDRCFNQREGTRDGGRQKEDSCKSYRQKGSSELQELA